MEKIEQFRQPMVTATGIFLGFMLEFTNSWMPAAFTKNRFKDIVLAVSVTVSLASLLLVLFRMLRMNYPVEPEKFYRRTLVLFLVGIAVPFVAFVIIMIERLVTTISAT